MDLSEVDEQGRSALHCCCDRNNTECARALLEDETTRNQILNLQDHEGCSALHLGKLSLPAEQQQPTVHPSLHEWK